MKRGRFNEEQIIGVLKQHEAGRKVPKLAREIGTARRCRAARPLRASAPEETRKEGYTTETAT